VLVHGLGNPVDARVVADRLVGRINANDFVILLRRVLVDPVTVQDTEIAVFATDLLFSETLQVAFELELIDTLVPVEIRSRGEKEGRELDDAIFILRETTATSTLENLLGLSEDHTTMVLTLTSTTADTSTHNHITLLSLESETVSLVRTRRTGHCEDVGALAVFPSADTQQEAQSI
jgi:hypothetical protein